jgi:hypothetical protein
MTIHVQIKNCRKDAIPQFSSRIVQAHGMNRYPQCRIGMPISVDEVGKDWRFFNVEMIMLIFEATVRNDVKAFALGSPPFVRLLVLWKNRDASRFPVVHHP